jgi:hypothetical protein
MCHFADRLGGLKMLQTLRAADERSGLGHYKSEQERHNGCGWKASAH